ncbi:MAG: hypothetical protein ABI678_29440 [Kofleriaceae bacterium]
MRTRGDELATAFARLATAFELDGRESLAAILARSGWGERPVAAPLLPSGVRHGVPWSLSISTTPGAVQARVWLEAQADPASQAAYLAAAEAMLGASPLIAAPQRLWHQLRFARGRAVEVETYACVPDRPELAWTAAGALGLELRAGLPSRARVTMVAGTRERMKLYVLVPASRPGELPFVEADARAFAQVVHPTDTPIGWLVAYVLAPDRPPAAALHFAAHVHGDPELEARLADHAAFVRARAALGAPALHFVAHARDKLNFYFLPEVAR